MKHKALIIVLSLFLLASLIVNAVIIWDGNSSKQMGILPNAEERYVYIAAYDDKALTMADNEGLQQFAREYGVSVEMMAPSQFDTVEQARLLLEVFGS